VPYVASASIILATMTRRATFALTNRFLDNLEPMPKRRALKVLEQAGFIAVEHRAGSSPQVTLLSEPRVAPVRRSL
jgi:hypothetical protein